MTSLPLPRAQLSIYPKQSDTISGIIYTVKPAYNVTTRYRIFSVAGTLLLTQVGLL